MSGLRVDLADSTTTFVIEFGGDIDTNSGEWVCTSLDGWGLPGPRQTWLPRVGAHGSIQAESVFDKKDISLGGMCKITSGENADFWACWDYLGNLLTHDLTDESFANVLTVYQLPDPLYTFTKLAGQPRMTIYAGYFEFQLSLTCGDPRKYIVGGGDPGSEDNPGTF